MITFNAIHPEVNEKMLFTAEKKTSKYAKCGGKSIKGIKVKQEVKMSELKEIVFFKHNDKRAEN